MGKCKMKWGFSLMELSVVLVIIGVVVGSSLLVGQQQISQQQIINSYGELKRIDDRLRLYAQRHGYIPCPTRLNLADTDSEYGRPASDCSDSSPPGGLTRVEYPASSGTYVRIGGIPFKALGLSEDFIADDWNNRYLYAVSENALGALTGTVNGYIRVQDGSGNTISDVAVYVLASHGKTGKGATSHASLSVGTACDAGNLDGENCDGDGVFIDARINEGDIAASFFDDYVIWKNRMNTLEEKAVAHRYFGDASSSGSSGSSSGSDGSIWMEMVGVLRGVTVPAIPGVPGGWPDYIACEGDGGDDEIEYLLRNYRYTEGDETVSYKGFGGRDFYFNLADGSYNTHDSGVITADCDGGGTGADLADMCAAGKCGYYTDNSGLSPMDVVGASDGFTPPTVTGLTRWPDYIVCRSSSDSNLEQIIWADRHDDDGGNHDFIYRGGNDHDFEYEFYINGNYKGKDSGLATNCGAGGNGIVAICTGNRCGVLVEDDVMSRIGTVRGFTPATIAGLTDGWPDIILCPGSDSDEEIPLYAHWYDHDYSGVKLLHYEDADGDYYRFNTDTGAKHSQSGHQTNCTESAGDIVTLCTNDRCGYLGN